jgi:hypothetical protein
MINDIVVRKELLLYKDGLVYDIYTNTFLGLSFTLGPYFPW